jgi:hypothetical protein
MGCRFHLWEDLFRGGRVAEGETRGVSLHAMLLPMANAEQGAPAAVRAKLRNSTTVFLVGNIEPTMEWYKRLGFQSEYHPPGFAILSRDGIQIFLQQQPGYVVRTIQGVTNATRGTSISSPTI